MITQFLAALFDHGRVQVGHPDQSLADDDRHNAGALLEAFERVRELGFPGERPLFSLPAAMWAGQMLYRGCQAATFRDLPAEALPQFFAEHCPQGDSHSLHYSVDLVFQFLPDLSKLAGHFAPDDPLVEHFRGWANQWPLSSVGMKEIVPSTLHEIVDHAGLLQYYVDRVIARRDVSRLAHPQVNKAVRRTLSLYPQLFPELAEHLKDVS